MNKIKFGRLIMLSVGMIAILLPVGLAHAQAPYFQAVTNLNPVGYWPMHEAEAPVPGDIETNYGSAGPLANGYYADWAFPRRCINHPPIFSPGPAIAGDSDPCLSVLTL